MSFANENNQSNDIDGNECFVNDKTHINDTVSGKFVLFFLTLNQNVFNTCAL